MSLAPPQHERDHEMSPHQSRESVPHLKVLTPYDEVSKVYPPESLNWRDLPAEQASCNDGAAINGANEAFMLKKLPCFSELLDWRDLYDLKLTGDDVPNKSESTLAKLENMHRTDCRDLDDEQETCGDAARMHNVFDKTEVEHDNQRLFKRAKKSVDVRENDEEENTKYLLQKYIKESSFNINGVVKHEDKHWSSLLAESKSFAQLAQENQTNEQRGEPSSQGLMNWLFGWWSSFWNKVGFLGTQKESSLQTSNSPDESARNQLINQDQNQSQLLQRELQSKPVPTEGLRSHQTPLIKDLSE